MSSRGFLSHEQAQSGAVRFFCHERIEQRRGEIG